MTEMTLIIDPARISQCFSHLAQKVVEQMHVADCVSSTNDEVFSRLDSAVNYVVCIANQQTDGRGRNGKTWHSPTDSNLYMSIGFNGVTADMSHIGFLSLAVAVSISRVLEAYGVAPEIKWPNDILVKGKKIAGLLLETKIKAESVQTVIGVGLNINMSANQSHITQPWTDLSTVLCGNLPEINAFVAECINAVIMTSENVLEKGFETYYQDWLRYELLTGKTIWLDAGQGRQKVRVNGYTDALALKVDIDGRERVFFAADVSLKMEDSC